MCVVFQSPKGLTSLLTSSAFNDREVKVHHNSWPDALQRSYWKDWFVLCRCVCVCLYIYTSCGISVINTSGNPQNISFLPPFDNLISSHKLNCVPLEVLSAPPNPWKISSIKSSNLPLFSFWVEYVNDDKVPSGRLLVYMLMPDIYFLYSPVTLLSNFLLSVCGVINEDNSCSHPLVFIYPIDRGK